MSVFAPCPARERARALDHRLGAGVFLLGAADVFRNDVLPPPIPMAHVATLLLGCLLLLSPTFRRIVAAVPQHWLIGIQTFRIREACSWSAIFAA
jgi:hypothetical protein